MSAVYATRSALTDATRLLPDRVLELEVERAVLRGAKRRNSAPEGVHLAPGEQFVYLPRGLGAVVDRRPSPLCARPSWYVVRVLRVGHR